MTIYTDSALSSTLVAAGQENNPIVAHTNFGATATSVTTTTGTEVSAAVNAVSTGTYNFWECTPVSNFATMRITLPAATALDFVGIAGHNFGSLPCNVKVQYSTNGGSTWNSVPAGDQNPTDDKALGFRFASITAQDWRILTRDHGPGNARMSVVLLSNEIIIPRRFYQGYAPPITPTNVEAQTNVSEGGHFLAASSFVRGSSASVTVENVDEAFVRGADWTGFQDAFNKGDAFFLGVASI